MPAVRNYIVREERQVKVSASSPAEAVEIANATLTNHNSSDPSSGIRITHISATED